MPPETKQVVLPLLFTLGRLHGMLGTSQTQVNYFNFLIFYNKKKSGDEIPRIAPEFQTLSFSVSVYLVYN